ncbi:MAG: ribosome recycling factor [Chloroflexota bacterium]|nr:ribosome recycling factor [Anaerolineales bacterium]MCA9974886.1 ribosome recycling factor [Anaerolineales bacterium]MCB8969058.1 ribosome recycling factor [Ardenticatenaceae bacterium]
MIRELLQEAEGRMKGAVTSLEGDLSGYRTGRASPHLIEKLVIEQYGVELQLQQMAVISVPEPRQLAVRPYDTKSLSAIERAIMKSDLGIMPNNDGKVIRLNIPPLTEERRRDLNKLVGKRVEEAKVAVRNVRRDTLNDLREFEKEKMISEDDFHVGQDDLQELTDKYVSLIDETGKRKEAEIMEV